MNHPLTPEQLIQIKAEKFRRTHDMLAECDAALRELESDMTRYTIAEYNVIFQAIKHNREQIREELETLTQ